MSNFSFSHSVFFSFGEHSAIFIKAKIVVCKLFQFEKSWKFVVRKRVKEPFTNTVPFVDILDLDQPIENMQSECLIFFAPTI